MKENNDWWKDIKVDNTTHDVFVPTPKGWKCKKKGCTTDVKHEHSTYDSLKR